MRAAQFIKHLQSNKKYSKSDEWGIILKYLQNDRKFAKLILTTIDPQLTQPLTLNAIDQTLNIKARAIYK